MKTTSKQMNNNIDAVLALSARILTLRSELQPWRDRLVELTGLEHELQTLVSKVSKARWKAPDTPEMRSFALPVPDLPEEVVRKRGTWAKRGTNGQRIMQVLRDSEKPLTYTEIVRTSGVPSSSTYAFLKTAVKDSLIRQTGVGTYEIKNRDKAPVAVMKSLE